MKIGQCITDKVILSSNISQHECVFIRTRQQLSMFCFQTTSSLLLPLNTRVSKELLQPSKCWASDVCCLVAGRAAVVHGKTRANSVVGPGSVRSRPCDLSPSTTLASFYHHLPRSPPSPACNPDNFLHINQRSVKKISPRSTSLTIAAVNVQSLGTAQKRSVLSHFIHEHNVNICSVSKTLSVMRRSVATLPLPATEHFPSLASRGEGELPLLSIT